jgi:hypothetical protein
MGVTESKQKNKAREFREDDSDDIMSQSTHDVIDQSFNIEGNKGWSSVVITLRPQQGVGLGLTISSVKRKR